MFLGELERFWCENQSKTLNFPLTKLKNLKLKILNSKKQQIIPHSSRSSSPKSDSLELSESEMFLGVFFIVFWSKHTIFNQNLNQKRKQPHSTTKPPGKIEMLPHVRRNQGLPGVWGGNAFEGNGAFWGDLGGDLRFLWGKFGQNWLFQHKFGEKWKFWKIAILGRLEFRDFEKWGFRVQGPKWQF